MTSNQPSAQNDTREESAGGDQDSPLASRKGKTSIADTVVSKIAGIATREVNGV